MDVITPGEAVKKLIVIFLKVGMRWPSGANGGVGRTKEGEIGLVSGRSKAS